MNTKLLKKLSCKYPIKISCCFLLLNMPHATYYIKHNWEFLNKQEAIRYQHVLCGCFVYNMRNNKIRLFLWKVFRII
jgi:hypothetical protein